MATKKSKRSTASKKSTKPASTKQTKAEEAKVKAEEVVENDEPEVVEEVVEVVEVEAPVKDKTVDKDGKKKLTLSDKLAALNPAALIAELIGTFIITAIFIQLIGNSYFGLLGIALVITAVVIAFIGVSGAHFNPAITLAQWINRKINGVKAVAYLVAQVLGAILAFFVLTGINNAGYDYEATVRKGVESAGITDEILDQAGGYDAWIEAYGGLDSVASQLGITETAPELFQYDQLTEDKEWVALIAEILGSIVVGIGAAYAYMKRNSCKVAAGLAMGVSLIAGLVIAGGTAILNPAIAATMGVFGWGSFNTFLWPILVYVIGSVLGATIGFAIYKLLAKNETENAKAIED